MTLDVYDGYRGLGFETGAIIDLYRERNKITGPRPKATYRVLLCVRCGFGTTSRSRRLYVEPV